MQIWALAVLFLLARFPRSPYPIVHLWNKRSSRGNPSKQSWALAVILLMFKYGKILFVYGLDQVNLTVGRLFQ